MENAQKLYWDEKKSRMVLSSAAQVYNGNDDQNVTETVRIANVACTKLSLDAGTCREPPKKLGKNRALRRVTDVPPDELLALLNKHFVYDLKAGRMVHRTTRKVASQVSHANGGRYERRVINFEGITISEQVAVWMYVRGEPPPSLQGLELDHINGDATDNHITNLRLVTRLQNQWNAKTRKDNTSGVKGVALTRSGTYAANISINGKEKYLGAFKTLEEATLAYQQKSEELRGEYARHK